MLIFDPAKQDTGAGGSGCGCAASVLAEYLLPKLENGEWKRILFVPTGALMSKVSFQEGSSVPGIAQAVVIEREEDVKMGTFMEYFNAFWVGGLICALCQILLDRTKMLPGRIMVTLVCTGAVLSFLGLYDPFAEYAGAGASVPLLGFGHLLFQGVKDAVKESGF